MNKKESRTPFLSNRKIEGYGLTSIALFFLDLELVKRSKNAFDPQIEKKVEKVAEWLADAYAAVQKH